MNEEAQGLLAKDGQTTQRFAGESNYEEYNKMLRPKQPEPSKMDAIVILILLVMIGIAGFGVFKHYELPLLGKQQKVVDDGKSKAMQDLNPFDSGRPAVVQGVFDKINDGLNKRLNNPSDDAAIDQVLEKYINNIDSYSNRRTDSDDIEPELPDDQDQVSDLNDLIINSENQVQIIKPVFSKSQFAYRNVNGLRTLHVKGEGENYIVVTLRMGRIDDPEEQPGLTELVFRCLQTEFAVQVFDTYTTFTLAAEDVDQELLNLQQALQNPIFTEIPDQAQSLYDDLMLESKFAQLSYVVQQFKRKPIEPLRVEPDELLNHLKRFLSADNMSLVVKSQHDFRDFEIENCNRYSTPEFENYLPQGRHILKFKSNYDQLGVLSYSQLLSCQRFLKYLLPKPFKAILQNNYLLVVVESQLGLLLNNVHQLMEYFEFLKQTDENQMQLTYSQMLATEELLFNSKFDENLNEIGVQLLLQDPIYALKGQESMPIYDKEEFDSFLDQFAEQFVVLIASQGFIYDENHASLDEDQAFTQDAVVNQKYQEFLFDMRDFTYTSQQKYNFVLPPLSPFLPENVAILSVCTQPYPVAGLGEPTVTDLVSTVQVNKFEGSKELRFEEVDFHVEFPMPDFKTDCVRKEKAAKSSLAPYQLAVNVWWKPSHLSAMVYTGLFIQKPKSGLAEGKTMLKLLQKYYTEIAKRQLQQEFLFGYELTVRETINGLNVQVLSYSEKQDEFLDKVFDILDQNDESLFKLVKDLLKKDVKRFHDQKVALLAQQYYLPKIMLRPVNTPEEILAVLDHVSYEQFLAFKDALLSSKIQILNLGNILPSDSVFTDSQELYWTKTLKLSGEFTYAVQRESSSNSDQNNQTATVHYYQLGLSSIASQAEVQFYADYLTERARTYFSVGETVIIKRRALGCADGLQIYLQGPAPRQGSEEIASFLATANSEFEKMQPGEKEQLRKLTVQRLHEEIKFKTIQDEGNYIWERIVNENYGFQEPQLVIDYLQEADLKLPEFQGQIKVLVFAQEEDFLKNAEDAWLSEQEAIGQDVYECFYTL